MTPSEPVGNVTAFAAGGVCTGGDTDLTLESIEDDELVVEFEDVDKFDSTAAAVVASESSSKPLFDSFEFKFTFVFVFAFTETMTSSSAPTSNAATEATPVAARFASWPFAEDKTLSFHSSNDIMSSCRGGASVAGDGTSSVDALMDAFDDDDDDDDDASFATMVSNSNNNIINSSSNSQHADAGGMF